jgi:hypothetical protein
MMPYTDLTGLKKGKIQVIKFSGRSVDQNTKIMWECLCECGNIKVLSSANIRGNTHVKCNCYRCLDKAKTSSPLYSVWANMIQRCLNPKNAMYYNYGGRGILVCDRWRLFENFYDDLFLSYSPGLHLDRIDNNGNYELANTQWITQKENNRKSRRAKLTIQQAVEIRLSTLSYEELAKKYSVSISSIGHVKSKITWV